MTSPRESRLGSWRSLLAKDVSKRIEAEMQYPGHIKVVVIRETRAVEVAK